jgi:deoxyribodipyrimidine photolyase-related protein
MLCAVNASPSHAGRNNPNNPNSAGNPDAADNTVWVLGDQLNRGIASLGEADPSSTVVLMIRSEAKLASKAWHRQKAHAILAGMARFAESLRAEGFRVDERRAVSFEEGLAAHRSQYRPARVRLMAPESFAGERMAGKLGVETVQSNQFLCSKTDFADWARRSQDHNGRVKMEDFYRWQRKRLGILMDGDEPAGGRWNFDHDNRLPPPSAPVAWPEMAGASLDEIDLKVVDSLPGNLVGDDPGGWWPTDRASALQRLHNFVGDGLGLFGPYEDAMLAARPRMAHSMLSQALNMGLLTPGEVCETVEGAYRAGAVPISSAEGFIRQVLGWREYIRGLYWWRGRDYANRNELGATRSLPACFGTGDTSMRCVGVTLAGVRSYGWVHHIPRLMVLANLATLAGVRPGDVVEWMWESFVDSAEWVMIPNVIGMGMHADGGLMSTKPYVSGGAYINRMSDFCKGCAYDYRKRVGDDACPFSTLYWSFLDMHRERLSTNPRMARQLAGLDRLGDLEAVRLRSEQVLDLLDKGRL